MRVLILIIIGALSITASFAQKGGGYGDDLGSGSDEFEFERYSNENVLALIDRDMEFACNKAGLCTIHSVTSNDRRFTASFSFGEGGANGQFGNQQGGTVILAGGNGGANNCASCPRDFWGVNLEFTSGRCTQTVKVPRALYISMNRYMYALMDEEGNTRRGFDPAKEAMIMFYTTIMKEAKGCTAPK